MGDAACLRRCRWPCAALLLVSLCACTPDFAFDLDGRRIEPLTSVRPTVLLFVSTTCPISNRYAPEFRRLVAAYSPRGVEFDFVYSDRHDSAADIAAHRVEYELNVARALRDPDHRLARHAHIQVTPEAALFADRKLIYDGRIDDRFVALGRERPTATQYDLADAIEAVLAHRAPPQSVSEAVGCLLPI